MQFSMRHINGKGQNVYLKTSHVCFSYLLSFYYMAENRNESGYPTDDKDQHTNALFLFMIEVCNTDKINSWTHFVTIKPHSDTQVSDLEFTC